MSQLPEDLSQLLRAARREEDPSDEDRRAVRRALAARLLAAGVAISSTTVVAKVGAAAPGSMLATVATYATVGFAVGAVSVAAVVGTLHRPPPSARAPRAVPTTLSPAPATGSAPRIAPSTSGSLPVPMEVTPSATSPRTPTPSPASSLEDEARALVAVQRALRDGRPAEALRLLEVQQRSFKGGALDEERAAAEVLALCDVGREGEAREAAARFLAAHPSSPIAARVSAHCAQNER